MDLYNPTRQGTVLVWTSPMLPTGQHPRRLRVTGTANPSATNTWVVPDRVEITSSS